MKISGQGSISSPGRASSGITRYHANSPNSLIPQARVSLAIWYLLILHKNGLGRWLSVVRCLLHKYEDLSLKL